MMRIAIVGTIGSGKSEALKVAREMGFATLSADEINSQLLRDPQYVRLVEQNFPSAVNDGVVNRAKLARIVFADAKKRAELNALAHPRILERIERETADPLVVEMPLFFESGAARLFDKVILLTCSDDVRRQRLLNRGMSEEDIAARCAAQQTERNLAAADVAIHNDGSLDELRENMRAALAKLTK